MGLALLQAVPGSLANVASTSVLADAVSPERLVRVISIRMALGSITSTLAMLVAGQLLNRLPFSINYQLVFGIGTAGGLLNVRYFSRIVLIGATNLSPAVTVAGPVGWKAWRDLLCGQREFVRFLGGCVCLHMGFLHARSAVSDLLS